MFCQFLSLGIHRQKRHGAKSGSEANGIDFQHILADNNNDSLQNGLETCKHFLVDPNMEIGKHRINNFLLKSLNPHVLI